jgi:hypothetical protein
VSFQVLVAIKRSKEQARQEEQRRVQELGWYTPECPTHPLTATGIPHDTLLPTPGMRADRARR